MCRARVAALPSATLPPDAQIDGLALDVNGGFVDGAFVDKERGAKIWRGVIDKATPRIAPHPSQEIIWVEGRWRDPALLDWKRGGRFELRVYPIPAHGARSSSSRSAPCSRRCSSSSTRPSSTSKRSGPCWAAPTGLWDCRCRWASPS